MNILNNLIIEKNESTRGNRVSLFFRRMAVKRQSKSGTQITENDGKPRQYYYTLLTNIKNTYF